MSEQVPISKKRFFSTIHTKNKLKYEMQLINEYEIAALKTNKIAKKIKPDSCTPIFFVNRATLTYEERTNKIYGDKERLNLQKTNYFRSPSYSESRFPSIQYIVVSCVESLQKFHAEKIVMSKNILSEYKNHDIVLEYKEINERCMAILNELYVNVVSEIELLKEQEHQFLTQNNKTESSTVKNLVQRNYKKEKKKDKSCAISRTISTRDLSFFDFEI